MSMGSAAANSSVTPSHVAADSNASPAPSGYILGPGDQLSFFVSDLDEFANRTFSVDALGEVHLPLIGQIHAAGLTASDLAKEMTEHLKKFVRRPEVVANISSFQSQPVSVLGAVNSPGVRQLEGTKSLMEMLSLAGGLRPNAGNTITITRDSRMGPIPLPKAEENPSKKFSVASLKVKPLISSANPDENITVKAHDVITVSTADVVYAVGSINKPGGFVLGENETLSALQVVSLAEGLQKTAAADKAKILRQVPGTTTRTEIPVNLKLLLAGKNSDVALRSNDILFVPTSLAKVASYRTVEAVVQSAVGIAVYSHF